MRSREFQRCGRDDDSEVRFTQKDMVPCSPTEALAAHTKRRLPGARRLRKQFVHFVGNTMYKILLVDGKCNANAIWEALFDAALTIDIAKHAAVSRWCFVNRRARGFFLAARLIVSKCFEQPDSDSTSALTDHMRGFDAMDDEGSWATCMHVVEIAKEVTDLSLRAINYCFLTGGGGDLHGAFDAMTKIVPMLQNIDLNDAERKTTVQRAILRARDAVASCILYTGA